MELDDLQVVEATLNGDRDAYARLIDRYQSQIGARMWRFTRDRVIWEELVQDVFVEAYMSLGGFKGRAPFGHWLNRIATRVGYQFWKRREKSNTVQLTENLEITAPATTMDSDLESSNHAADLVHAQLAHLPPRDRLVLTLMYLEEASVEKVSQLTGWSKSMVKVQAHRARKKLKRLLEQVEPHYD